MLPAAGIVLLLGITALVTTAPKVSAYTPHAPIRIYWDGDFTAANGVTGGTGTPSDPYVIEGWEISTSTWHGIDVRDTNASFVIRGNFIHSGAGSFTGVSLLSVRNGSVRDNTITDYGFGIRFDVSRNVVVAGNNLSNSRDAIYLGGSADSNLTANRISSSTGYGILLTQSDNITIAANTLSNDVSGIGLSMSTNVTLRANRFTLEGVHIDDHTGSDAIPYVNTHTISPDNLVNGKPLYYYKDCTGLSVDSLAVGELIVVNCRGVRVTNLDIADTDFGIEMAYVTDATLSANRLTRNDVGVRIQSSRDVVLSDNNATQNGHGLWLRYMTGVTVLANNLSRNDEGMHLDVSANASLFANRVFSNARPGVVLGPGVQNVEIVSNILWDNEWGLYENGMSANITLRANDISSNRVGGLDFSSTANLTLSSNRVVGNGDYGVIVGYGADTLITDNAIENHGTGIYLYGRPMGSTGDLVHHNRITNNGVQGFDNQGAENAWDDGYPSGGNWWSDYGGVDECSGPNQDVCPDPDGIGDTPYVLDADSRDRYPLMRSPPPQNVPPVAVVSVDPNVLAPGQLALVTANGSFDPDGTITAYNFTFGDGTWTGDTATPYIFHSWPSTGDYLVEVVVTDDRGATAHASAHASVAVDLPPHAVAKVSPASPGNLATAFTFDGTDSWDSEGPVAAYLWEFGDGTNAAGPTAAHRYATRGTFTVTLTVSDDAGATDQASVAVTVSNRPPEITSTSPATYEVVFASSGQRRLSVTAADPDGDPLAFTWEIDGTPAGSMGELLDLPVSFAGTHVVNVTVSDGLLQDWHEWVVRTEADSTPWNSLLLGGIVLAIAVALAVIALSVFRRRQRQNDPVEAPAHTLPERPGRHAEKGKR